MRKIAGLLTLIALFCCQKSSSQTDPPFAPGAQPQGSQQPAQQFYAQDGGSSEYLESIVIPPKAQAPFSLVLQTEWVKTLSDGGTMTLVNKRRLARDSAGRVYQERWLLVPKMGKAQSHMTTIQINDPVKHVHYACFMTAKRECTLNNFSVPTNAIYKFQGPPTGPLRGDAGYAIHDDLGQQILQGLETSGTRDRVTYNPGVLETIRR